MTDDDPPTLRPEALAALSAFLADRHAAATADPHAPDYGLSQFWYTDATADAVAGAVAGAVGPSGRVACVSCPSLFKALLRLERAEERAEEAGGGSGGGGGGGGGRHGDDGGAAARPAPPPSRHALLEFDDRFATLGPFSHYDYRTPAAFEPAWVGAFDAVVADPPYLSAECLERTAVTVAALERRRGRARTGGGGGGAGGSSPSSPTRPSRPSSPSSPSAAAPVRVLLSGAAVRATAWSALRLKPVTFRPEHSCKLGNEFLCYTDSEAVAGVLGGWDGELGPEAE